MKPLIPAAALVLVLAGSARAADDFAPAMQRYLDAEIRAWAQDPRIIDAVRAQNLRHAGLTPAEIDSLDQSWRAEVGSGSTPTLTPVLGNTASDFLRARVEAAGGTITEVFVMDAHGLNVAASEPTSDYWQGDEAKFTETFGKGPGAVHFGEVAFDESSQRYQAQVSIALVDPVTQTVVGAMTIGLDAESLF
ncbi:hypothetical protein ACRDNQ_15205 [Palleronia sp. KMU-117]|uniref:hypothetical protein n=1 Tax=Palleronia sp. KMU-117 TaxID=3434108 RepID=UPI003D74A422